MVSPRVNFHREDMDYTIGCECGIIRGYVLSWMCPSLTGSIWSDMDVPIAQSAT
jgi:hypothetical protein